MSANSSAGKGDKPRNCFSEKFKSNYDIIKWSKKNTKKDLAITRNKK